MLPRWELNVVRYRSLVPMQLTRKLEVYPPSFSACIQQQDGRALQRMGHPSAACIAKGGLIDRGGYQRMVCLIRLLWQASANCGKYQKNI